MRAAPRRSGSKASGRRSPTARSCWRQLLAAPGIEFASLEDEDTATLWREIRDVALLHPERMLWRMSVPPAAASELVDWTASLTSERLFDWAGGLIWLAPKDIWAQGGRDHARGAGRARRACDTDARPHLAAPRGRRRSSRSRRRCGR